MQYYFNGPDESLDPNRQGAAAAGLADGGVDMSGGPGGAPPFRLVCSDTSPGLGEWEWEFEVRRRCVSAAL